VRGAVNVAGPGTIGLTRMVRLAGRPSLPVLPALFDAVTGLGQRFGLVEFSDDFKRLLRHGRATDTTRLVEDVGYSPRHSTVDAVEDYVRTQGGRRLVPNLRQAVAP
jgi:UDP-glucose 4-epimerase